MEEGAADLDQAILTALLKSMLPNFLAECCMELMSNMCRTDVGIIPLMLEVMLELN